jgi:multidrug efflux pump subunit AcrB
MMAAEHWTARHGKPIVFVILALVAAGLYLATTIPVAVFPEVEFPRIIVGVDNGVAPIEQMQVTVTRPIEEAVNSVQGLERVQSVTSRGTAELNLFFSWNVDMFQTLMRVNAALARVQPELAQVLSGVEPGQRVVTVGGLGIDDKATVHVIKPGEKSAADESDKDDDEKDGKN